MSARLSVVISAYNEEKMIKDCLESVKWADEVIVIDNQSTDNTVKIAKKYTKKIYSRPNNPMLNVNKNYGFTKASGEWILSLDADERIEKELKNEILKITHPASHISHPTNGYRIPRKNIIFGKWIKHTGWYPDYQLRLFKKGKGKFPEKHVHEMVKVIGKTEKLKNHIKHHNYKSIDQFLHKLFNIYANNEAQNLIESGYKFRKKDIIRFPAKEFISRYFARKGYKDGLHGLSLSLLMAFYHTIVILKIWEKGDFKEENFTLSEFELESKKIYDQTRHWIRQETIENEENAIKKIFLKFLKIK